MPRSVPSPVLILAQAVVGKKVEPGRTGLPEGGSKKNQKETQEEALKPKGVLGSAEQTAWVSWS